MLYGMEEAFVTMHAIILALEKNPEKRMAHLEEFADIGLSIRNWEERLIEALKNEENGEAAIETVEQFHAKYNVYDENGPVFYRRRIGNDYHHTTITFDRNKPEGEQFLIEEYPDLDNMTLPELEEYLEEVESALCDMEDDEPDESDEEEHKYWQEFSEELEELMCELEDRISDLENKSENT